MLAGVAFHALDALLAGVAFHALDALLAGVALLSLGSWAGVTVAILTVPNPLLEGTESTLEVVHYMFGGVIRQRRGAESE